MANKSYEMKWLAIYFAKWKFMSFSTLRNCVQIFVRLNIHSLILVEEKNIQICRKCRLFESCRFRISWKNVAVKRLTSKHWNNLLFTLSIPVTDLRLFESNLTSALPKSIFLNFAYNLKTNSNYQIETTKLRNISVN